MFNEQPLTSTKAQILSDILAQERAQATQLTTASRRSSHVLLWGLMLMQALALLLTLSILTITPSSSPDAADLVSPVQLAPQETPPIQPDVTLRQLLPPPPNQIGDTLPVNTTGLRVRGMELTQGIQVFAEPENPRCQPDPTQAGFIFCNNSMPMVAGRPTMLRVYLACEGSCPTQDRVLELHVYKEGLRRATFTQQLSPSFLNPVNNLPMPTLRGHLTHSLNFEFNPLPDGWVGGLTFELTTAAPASSLIERVSRLTPNVIKLATLSREFTPRKTLKVAYLPIQYQGQTPAPIDNADYWLNRMFPVPQVEYYRLPVPDLVWEGELNKNTILQKLLYTYWLYAIYHPTEAWPDQLFGWLPQAAYNGGASDPYWCPACAGPHSSRVAFGGVRTELDIGGPRILVHEIAHNLGAQHAWSPTQSQDVACFRAEGADIQVDPNWPYQETPFIQEVGLDLFTQPPLIYPASRYDLMAYCTQPWISPYTYRTLFNSPFLDPHGTTALPLGGYEPLAQQTDTGALLISGIVYRDGQVSEPEIIQLEGPTASALAEGFNPPTTGDYCFEVRNAAQRSLGRQCFETGFVNVETGLPNEEASPYFITIPNIAMNEATEVILQKRNKTLLTLEASNTAPQIDLLYPRGGELLDGQQTLQWHAHDADGDKLFYDVLYSPDAGQSWLPLAVRLTQSTYTFHTRQLPPSDHALLRVTASDGFHQATAELNQPIRINTPLDNSLSLQGPVSVRKGEKFTVTLQASQLHEVAALALTLHVEADILEIQDIIFHNNLKVTSETTSPTGEIEVTAQTAPLHGDITLLTVELLAKKTSSKTHLYLSQVNLYNQRGQPLKLREIWDMSLQVVRP